MAPRAAAPRRAHPSILITGTPGTGKTTTAEAVAAATGLAHLNVGELVKEQGLHAGWDEGFQAFILDEDKVVDALEEGVGGGGALVDHHGCDFFPERWFDLVVVLTADNGVLHERLTRRGYPPSKVSENVECEIMMVVLEEASDSYPPHVLLPLPSNSVEELEANVGRIVEWVRAFRAAAAASAGAGS